MNLVGLLVCARLCVYMLVCVPLKAGGAVGQRELLAFGVHSLMGASLSK